MHQDDTIIFDIDENLQGPKMYLCAKFGSQCLGGVCGQTNRFCVS